MPRFAYTAVAATGTPVSGEVAAETEALALDQIARRGLTPVSLTEGGDAGPWWNRDIALFGTAGALRPATLERFFATLAALLGARLALPRALAFCAAEARDPRLAGALRTTLAEVENGAGLAVAMRAAGPAFPERFTALVAVGEAANRLPETVSRAAELLSAELKLSRELRAALIYPVILLAMSALVLGVVVFYLAPTLLPVFASAGAEPPVFLTFLAGLGTALSGGWPAVLAALAALILAARAFRGTLSRTVSGAFLRLPMTGPYLRKRETLRAFQALHLMIDSGAPLPRAIAAAREAVALPAFRATLREAEDRVVAGCTLGDALDAADLIDPMALALLRAGEESDRLAPTLAAASRTLAEDTARTLAQAVRVLTPVLTLAIALGVGAIILSTITAILDLNDIAF
ncbi:MAG: type II secretion system F family protein [Rhodobacteraceae bacterium]|jgi:general secretion pathway protein F|nr:type II secretion system F family protein [Paracoccaceae bacterium]